MDELAAAARGDDPIDFRLKYLLIPPARDKNWGMYPTDSYMLSNVKEHFAMTASGILNRPGFVGGSK